MKLNYKRTILVGFAFFLISAFWGAYDAIVPKILTNLFDMKQGVSGFIMSFDNILAVVMLPVFGALSDKVSTKWGKRTPFVFVGTCLAVIFFIALGCIQSPDLLWLFIVVLLLTLISMATFRSPAVALMPDVTLKPLRSKGNAIINLMGTAGGIIVLALGIVFGTGKPENALMSYTVFFGVVGGLMLLALVAFLFTVNEPKLVREMEEESARLGLDTEDEPVADANVGAKLDRPHLVSLLLILASVALWYMGYNAVTTKYSVYAGNVLGLDYNTTLIIAQGAAIVAYIPAGIVATKLGRRKTILGGVVLLFAAFFFASFLREGSPALLVNFLFILAGIA
jgi:Na+/melibiose symporter-like transporter